MKCENFDELYNFLLSLNGIIPKSGGISKQANNIVGILKLSEYDITRNIMAINNIMESDIILDKLYLFNADSFMTNLCFKNLVTLYSNAIEFISGDTLDIINKHLNDTVYVFDINNNYNSLRFSHNKDTVYNLQFNDNTKLLSFNYSALIYRVHDDSKYYSDSIYLNTCSNKIPIQSDFVIPAKTFSEPLETILNVSLNVIVYLNVIKQGKTVDFIHKNCVDAVFDYDNFCKQIYYVLKNYKNYRDSWYKVFPDYITDFSNADFYSNDIDLVFLNSSNSEITVENFNRYASVFCMPCKSCSIFDNVDINNPENNIVQQLYRLNRTVPFNISYNNTDQLFTKLPLVDGNKPYGIERFDQTVKYLIENSESDILVIIGDKIIITKPLNFDTSNIWSGYVVNNINAFGYINIFNIKMMKDYGIEFEHFSDFYTKIQEENIPYSNIYPESFWINITFRF